MGIDWKEKIKEMTPKQFNELMHNLNQARLAAQAALIEAEERYEADSNDDVLESRRVARAPQLLRGGVNYDRILAR
ncbi:MAG: hypothetical protein UV22_C0008G0023 [Parcubacteria group bacterium GW2011_GWA2_42_35]|nr:MAG: hypothetical protein UV22_C0008G0023 [Parcubacteria group bacterium GW2011_GWA2_42_35]